MKEKIEINGIRDSDINKFLSKYDLLDDFVSGKIGCNCCGEIITMENLGGFLVKNEKLIVLCNISECLDYGVKKYEC